jgi:hypothetical protein
MIPHKALIAFGVMLLAGSVLGFVISSNRKWVWYFRYIAFAIGATFLVLGILIPISFWGR